MFGNILNRLKTEANNFAKHGTNKDFLEGAVAASALVASADGSIADDEVTATVDVLRSHPAIQQFPASQLDSTIDNFFEKAKRFSGRAQLKREISEVGDRARSSGDPSLAEDVLNVAIDVAYANGEADAKERAVLAEVASLLGVKMPSL